mgnify:CR=1 FL=1
MAKRSGTTAKSRRQPCRRGEPWRSRRRLADEVLRFRDQALRRRAAAVLRLSVADARAVSPRLIRATGWVRSIARTGTCHRR